jgi:hypothetical protein
MSQEPPSPVDRIKEAENYHPPSFVFYMAQPSSVPDRFVKSVAKDNFFSCVQRYWRKERNDLQQTAPLFQNAVMGQDSKNSHNREPAVWVRGYKALAVE